MVLNRMAPAPGVYVLLYLIVLAHAATCASFRLSQEVSSFIPACAELCFVSFLDVNYEGSGCGPVPSLRCLCSTRGNTEFTLGEGAAQCLTAETRFGSCSDDAVDQNTLDEAYFMCLDQPDAIEPTHEVITASLLLPTASGAPVRFPPPTTTRSNPDPRPPSTLTTKTSTSTKARPSSTDGETTATTTAKSTAISTTAGISTTLEIPSETAGPTNSPVGDGVAEDTDTNDDDDSPSLGAAQVAGISVGVVSAAGLAILAIVLARYCRKRRNPEMRSAFLPRRSTSAWMRGHDSPDPVPGGPGIPDPGTIPPPPAYTSSSYNRSSWKPDLIGVAISPAVRRGGGATPASPVRRISKLLPAKPELPPLPDPIRTSPDRPPRAQRPNQSPPPPRLPPLAGLSNPSSSSSLNNPPPPSNSNSKPPAAPMPLKVDIPTSNRAPAAPSAARARESTMTEFEEDGNSSALSPEGRIWRPPSSAPMSAAAPYYIADKNGNWVLSESPAAMDLPVELPGDAPLSKPEQRPPNSRRSVSAPLPSSVNNNKTTSPTQPEYISGVPSSVYSQTSSVPRPLFYNNDGRASSGSRTRQADDRASSLSSGVTLFENSSDEPTPPEVRGTLSPVFESPRSATGRSPVTYPEIPGRRRNSSSSSRPAPPPNFNNAREPTTTTTTARTDLLAPRRPPLHHGQPSPTLGMMPYGYRQPVRYNIPPNQRINPPTTSPTLVYGGSPPTIRIVDPSSPDNIDDRAQLLPSARAARVQQPPNPTPQPPYYAPPRIRTDVPQSANDHHHHRSPASDVSSTSSSLLAKRLGNDRAAQIAPLSTSGGGRYPTYYSSSSAGSPVPRWRRQDTSGPAGKSPLTQNAPPPRTPQPSTPGWMPRLTPTRKGEDLYLDVQ